MANNAASKVLIAEDNKALRQLLEVTLAKWGYKVIATRDGNEAWEQLQLPDSPIQFCFLSRCGRVQNLRTGRRPLGTYVGKAIC